MNVSEHLSIVALREGLFLANVVQGRGQNRIREIRPSGIVGRLAEMWASSPLKKAPLTGFHPTAKHNVAKAVSPSSEAMRTI